MKLSAGALNEDQKKKLAIGLFLALAVGVVWYEVKDTLFPDAAAPVTQTAPVAQTTPASAPSSRSGGEAHLVGSKAASLDPSLRMGPMLASESLVYAGVGRNIFSAASVPPPVAIPKPVGPPRPQPVAPPLPCPPNCPPPPPPPPIDLKFFGLEVAHDGTRQACLLHGDDVYLATAGQTVMKRYKILSVDAHAIQVEDMLNNNRQTLPLLAN